MQLSRSQKEAGRRCREAREESISGSQVTEVREIAGRKVSGYGRGEELSRMLGLRAYSSPGRRA